MSSQSHNTPGEAPAAYPINAEATLSAMCLHRTWEPGHLEGHAQVETRPTRLKIVTGMCLQCSEAFREMFDRYPSSWDTSSRVTNQWIMAKYWKRRAANPDPLDFPSEAARIMSIDAVVNIDQWPELRPYWRKKLAERVEKWEPVEVHVGSKRWTRANNAERLSASVVAEIVAHAIFRTTVHAQFADQHLMCYYTEPPWADASRHQGWNDFVRTERYEAPRLGGPVSAARQQQLEAERQEAYEASAKKNA
ncbi:hypothetical protein HIM_08094 [Hirsutella minnesotensis 3608]|uniref:Uncharacterized protein n=1 Tax=Hirsutella minnesotensis 3608 TaxID=1043627 RepID=A0A0F7ZMT7_9HYPO|nr:hypothetical protein HIM_08094 [Hirsutella minnesotensis 3608]